MKDKLVVLNSGKVKYDVMNVNFTVMNVNYTVLNVKHDVMNVNLDFKKSVKYDEMSKCCVMNVKCVVMKFK